MASNPINARYFLMVWLHILLFTRLIDAAYLLPRNAPVATTTTPRLVRAPSTTAANPSRTLHGGTQWISLRGTTEVQYDMTISLDIPVWTASETDYLTILPPTASGASSSTVYYSFITSKPTSTPGLPMPEPSIQAVVIAPALVPVLQRIISSGGGDQTNDTIDEQIVGELAARGYEPMPVEYIPILGALITYLRLTFSTNPDVGLKLAPYLDLNEKIPSPGGVVTVSSEEPVVTAIPEPQYPNWWNLRVYYPPMGPLPTDVDFDSSSSVAKPTSTTTPTPQTTYMPGANSITVEDAMLFAQEFCIQLSTSANDTCTYYGRAGSDQHFALAYEHINGKCMANCDTTFSNMFKGGQGDDKIYGAAIFRDGCGVFGYNITNVLPMRVPDDSVVERSQVPLPPPKYPAQYDICVYRGNIFPSPAQTCSLTIVGDSRTSRGVTYHTAYIFDQKCFNRGLEVGPFTSENITSELQDVVKINDLGFNGRTGATVQFCYGSTCVDSTKEKECTFNRNPFKYPNRFRSAFSLNCPFPC